MNCEINQAITYQGSKYLICKVLEGGKVRARIARRTFNGLPSFVVLDAATLVPWSPKAKVSAHAKTCQICGRSIFAATGMIAHHGYTRPHYGVQTSSCYGARELPFEVSRDVLTEHLACLASWIAAKEVLIAELGAGACEVYAFKTDRVTGVRKLVTLKPGDKSYEAQRQSSLSRALSELASLKDELALQRKRWSDWSPQK